MVTAFIDELVEAKCRGVGEQMEHEERVQQAPSLCFHSVYSLPTAQCHPHSNCVSSFSLPFHVPVVPENTFSPKACFNFP